MRAHIKLPTLNERLKRVPIIVLMKGFLAHYRTFSVPKKAHPSIGASDGNQMGLIEI